MKKVTFCELNTSLSRNFVYNLQTIRGFCQVHFCNLKIIFYLPVNTYKPKIVAFLVSNLFVRLLHLSLKFRLPKISRNWTPSWLLSQNSEKPRIFRVTGANRIARKLLFSDLVNTKKLFRWILLGVETLFI